MSSLVLGHNLARQRLLLAVALWAAADLHALRCIAIAIKAVVAHALPA